MGVTGGRRWVHAESQPACGDRGITVDAGSVSCFSLARVENGGPAPTQGCRRPRGRPDEEEHNDDQGHCSDVRVPRRVLRRAAGRKGSQGHERLDAGSGSARLLSGHPVGRRRHGLAGAPGFAGGERSSNSEIIEQTFAAAGAYVMGRRMFDAGEIPWGDDPPFGPRCSLSPIAPGGARAPGWHVVHVVTDGIEQALELARQAAGGRTWRWPAARSCCARCWPPGCSTSSSCTCPSAAG